MRIEDWSRRRSWSQRPAMKSGDTVRVHVKVREGDKERIQIFEGMVIGMHRGGVARLVHGAQGVVRPGRRAHLPAALADHRQGRGRPLGPGPPRQAVLPARPEGQGRAHEGTEAHRLRLGGPARLDVGHAASPRATRTVENASIASAILAVAGVDEVGPRLPGRPGGRRRRRPRSAAGHIPGLARLEAAHRRGARAAVVDASSATRWPGRSAGPSRTKSTPSTSTRRRCGRWRGRSWPSLRCPSAVLVDGFAHPRPAAAAAGHHRRRSPVRGHRRGLDCGQGHPGPINGVVARRRSSVWVRPAQGLRDSRTSGGRLPARVLGRAPAVVPVPCVSHADTV